MAQKIQRHLPAPHKVVDFICDIPPDIEAPAADIQTVEELVALAEDSTAAWVVVISESQSGLDQAIARLNRLNTGSKAAFVQAGAPSWNPETGKFESQGFIRPLQPEEEVRRARKRFGFI